MIGECNAAGCFLERNGGLVSFPLVTIAGIIDGINPCAIGMLLMLLGYLLVFAKKPEQVLKTGIIYIFTVFLTYLSIGLVFYQTVTWLQASPWLTLFNRTLGTILLLAAAIQIKDYFKPQWGPHLQIPSASKDTLHKLIQKSTLPTTIILAIIVTILETPCSLPLYVGTATILSQSGLGPLIVALYFIYYNFLFVLPLIIILSLVWKSKQVIELSEWKHKAEKYMKLALGLVTLILGVLLLT